MGPLWGMTSLSSGVLERFCHPDWDCVKKKIHTEYKVRICYLSFCVFHPRGECIIDKRSVPIHVYIKEGDIFVC